MISLAAEVTGVPLYTLPEFLANTRGINTSYEQRFLMGSPLTTWVLTLLDTPPTCMGVWCKETHQEKRQHQFFHC